MNCGRYIVGDTNTDGSRFIPVSDDFLDWDNVNFWYTPTDKLFQDELGINLPIEYGTNNKINGNVRDIILEYIDDNPNNNAQQITEFKIARTRAGRDGFKRACIAQMRYMDFDADDTDENADNVTSPRAKKILRNVRYGNLGHRGSYAYCVNPDITDDDGFRNYE